MSLSRQKKLTFFISSLMFFKKKEWQVKAENKYKDNINVNKRWRDVFKYLDTQHEPCKNMKAWTEFSLAGLRTTT